MFRFTSISLALTVLAIALGCGTRSGSPAPAPTPASEGPETRSAYERALLVKLDRAKPLDRQGIHNVFRLGEQIVSGSEPEGRPAFEALRKFGIKTVLSVDGKAPDLDLAKEFGFRYVHIPIEYSGLDDRQIMQITKTFRELEGPFYVHCFHGRHRGPAAAALGRIALDDVRREVALAEMRQWCGTSKKYDGLYDTVASCELPTVEESRAYSFSFPEQKVFDGERAIMIAAPRSRDKLKALSKRAWVVDSAHPDVDAVNEAAKLHELYLQLKALPEFVDQDDDYVTWIEEGVVASRDLLAATRALKKEGLHPRTIEVSDAALRRVGANCNACHAVYRD